MKKFLSKVGHFFWSWTFLKMVLWLATLVVFFYVEEDWRAARAWAATKAKWEAAGETFDYAKLVPPPVPDSQNLGALPIFALSTNLYLPSPLTKALQHDLPRLGHWKPGQWPDMAALQAGLVKLYIDTFKSPPPTEDPLQTLDAIYPFLPGLREAAQTRPFCRFPMDYTSQPPFFWPLDAVIVQTKLAQVLETRAVLALYQHQPEAALDDITVALRLAEGVRREPLLISGLVAIGSGAILNLGIINRTLPMQVWNDGQLAQIENELGKIDALSAWQFSLRGELIGEVIPNLDYVIRKRPGIIYKEMKRVTGVNQEPSMLWKPLPQGWLIWNKIQSTDALFEAITAVDPSRHRVQLDTTNRQLHEFRRTYRAGKTIAPWNTLYAIGMPPIISSIIKYARFQANVDEGRIACALERYRLAHGVYPATLDVLAPACIADLPPDVMNGEPYHYRLQPDGSFVLYSVGWNQQDDGGQVVTLVEHPVDTFDSADKHGDWVWPVAKR